MVRFARAYRGRRVYLPGVGTRFGTTGALLGGWIGLGLHQRVRETMKALRRNFDRGDTVIDVIGFSRGAAAALHFSNQVWEDIGKKQGKEPAIRFLGLTRPSRRGSSAVSPTMPGASTRTTRGA